MIFPNLKSKTSAILELTPEKAVIFHKIKSEKCYLIAIKGCQCNLSVFQEISTRRCGFVKPREAGPL